MGTRTTSVVNEGRRLASGRTRLELETKRLKRRRVIDGKGRYDGPREEIDRLRATEIFELIPEKRRGPKHAIGRSLEQARVDTRLSTGEVVPPGSWRVQVEGPAERNTRQYAIRPGERGRPMALGRQDADALKRPGRAVRS